jgi:hypothetical protein
VLGVNGATAQGWAIANFNCQYNAVGCGTIFDISLAGTLTILFTLCPNGGCAFGEFDGLMLATNGNFYGGQLNYGVGTPLRA